MLIMHACSYQNSFIGFVKSQSNFIKYFVKDILASVKHKHRTSSSFSAIRSPNILLQAWKLEFEGIHLLIFPHRNYMYFYTFL